MENKAKIILFCQLFLLSLLSCKNNLNDCLADNESFSFKKDSLNNLILNVNKYSKPHSINLIQINGTLHKLEDVIDCKSFINIFDGKDSIKLNNSYYKSNPIMSYFKDRNYLYFYLEDSNYLIIKGEINSYNCLGGPYLAINGKVYYEGEEVIGADITSFKTLNVYRDKSEWMKTVGLDKRSIYNGKSKMTQEMFNRLIWRDLDSLKHIYFNNCMDKP